MAATSTPRPLPIPGAAGEDQASEQEGSAMAINIPAPRAPQQTPRQVVIGRNGTRIPGTPRSAR